MSAERRAVQPACAQRCSCASSLPTDAARSREELTARSAQEWLASESCVETAGPPAHPPIPGPSLHKSTVGAESLQHTCVPACQALRQQRTPGQGQVCSLAEILRSMNLLRLRGQCAGTPKVCQKAQMSETVIYE